MGNILEDFNRLDIEVRQTYNGEEYGVCEVTDEEFKMLCVDEETEDTWQDCGWRYCEGSNQGEVNSTLIIGGKELNCWFTPFKYDDEEATEEDNNEQYLPEYNNLLTYLCEEIGCSQPRNICALTKDLAKCNNIKLSDLFKIYQS